MSEVERYSPFEDAYSRAGMVPDDEGEYVEHSDYVALAQRVEELERIVAVRVDDEKGLVAENQRLREALKELGGICGIHSSGWMIAQEALEASDE